MAEDMLVGRYLDSELPAHQHVYEREDKRKLIDMDSFLLEDSMSFSERVYHVVQQIPKGCVSTYGQVAALIGSPRSARFVGYALHSNPYPHIVPCHRVVFKDGALASGFAFGGPEEQFRRLSEEGVEFTTDDDGIRRVILERYQWRMG